MIDCGFKQPGQKAKSEVWNNETVTAIYDKDGKNILPKADK